MKTEILAQVKGWDGELVSFARHLRPELPNKYTVIELHGEDVVSADVFDVYIVAADCYLKKMDSLRVETK